jgi:hypothetical protein
MTYGEFFSLLLGFGLGAISIYVAIILKISLFLIPLQHIKIRYYKFSSSTAQKLNEAKFETELQRKEAEALNSLNKN